MEKDMKKESNYVGDEITRQLTMILSSEKVVRMVKGD